MNVMSSRILLLFTIAAFMLITPAPIHAWEWKDAMLKRVSLPSVLQTVETKTSADFDFDGIPDTLILIDGHATIKTEDRIRWQSPQAWRVTQAQIADLNRDGQPEVALLVWRPFRPWPVDAWLPNGGRIRSFHDSKGESCHIILIGWKRDAFRELWAGSALAEPIKAFAAVDLTESGRQYLVALESEYDDLPVAPARRLKVWEWNGFGFTVVNKLKDAFNLMVITQTEAGRVLILTD